MGADGKLIIIRVFLINYSCIHVVKAIILSSQGNQSMHNIIVMYYHFNAASTPHLDQRYPISHLKNLVFVFLCARHRSV